MYIEMNQFKIRRSIVGITIALTLIASFIGTVVLPTPMSAHAASINTAYKFDRHDIFPVKQLLKNAQKLNATALGTPGTIPSCLTSAVAPRCYSPQQMRNAYGIQSLFNAGMRGAGHTVVLIDFATSPTLQSDVHIYDQLYGLKDPKINVISPFGAPSVDPGSYVETALDIETVHALAPDATIDLVLANTDTATSFEQILTIALQSTQYAVQHDLGDVISQSFGVGESCVTPSYVQAEQHVFAQARAKGITVLASSGDFGAAVITCVSTPSGPGFAIEQGVNLPAADPLVTAVGGTTLDATLKTGKYVSETTWSANGQIALLGATGGGVSTLFPSPSYQKGITGLANRAIPDVAFDADPATGVPIVFSQNGGLFIVPVGGTSVGSPAWAAMVVLANQVVGHRLGFLNDALYGISTSKNYGKAFHDVTTGDNAVQGIDVNGNLIPVAGFAAGQGWDAVTGIGTPLVKELAHLLAK